MRVEQRLDYVLRALAVLATLPPGTGAPAGRVADQLGLPRRFVEQQLTALGKRGIVVAQRGPGGGSALARPADEISVADVVVALHGEVLDVPRVAGSAVSEMWSRVAGTLATELSQVTLADLSARQLELDDAEAYVYHI